LLTFPFLRRLWLLDVASSCMEGRKIRGLKSTEQLGAWVIEWSMVQAFRRTIGARLDKRKRDW
jgi:hypothetical protein